MKEKESAHFARNDSEAGGGASAALAFQCALYASRAASDDCQIGLRGLIGCGAALFPIARVPRESG